MATHEWKRLCAAVEAYVDHPVGRREILARAYDYGAARLDAVLAPPPMPAGPPSTAQPRGMPGDDWFVPGLTIRSSVIETHDPAGNPRPEDWLG